MTVPSCTSRATRSASFGTGSGATRSTWPSRYGYVDSDALLRPIGRPSASIWPGSGYRRRRRSIAQWPVSSLDPPQVTIEPGRLSLSHVTFDAAHPERILAVLQLAVAAYLARQVEPAARRAGCHPVDRWLHWPMPTSIAWASRSGNSTVRRPTPPRWWWPRSRCERIIIERGRAGLCDRALRPVFETDGHRLS